LVLLLNWPRKSGEIHPAYELSAQNPWWPYSSELAIVDII
jgi:hypothetical protein